MAPSALGAFDFESWFEDAFWRSYPKKKSKPRAKKAARAALKKTDAGVIIKALEAAKRTDGRFREAQFTPYPESWLNSEPWNDGDDAGARGGDIGDSGDMQSHVITGGLLA